MARILQFLEWEINEASAFKKVKTLPETEKSLSTVSKKLREIFYRIQNEFGEPLTLKSGSRDAQANKKAGGAKNSAHLRNLAIDIKLPPTGGDQAKVKQNREKIKRLIKIASNIDVSDLGMDDEKLGDNQIMGIGVYRDAEDLHLDNDGGLGKRAWGPNYSSSSIPTWAKPEVEAHLEK